MKQLLFVWVYLAWCLAAAAQPAAPLPLRPGFLNGKAAATGTTAFDTVARRETTQIPGRVAYLGPYVLFVSERGELSMASALRGQYAITPLFSPNNAWGVAEVSRCSSVYGDKIVLVSITDGYVQPKRYTVVELSLARQAVVRLYRSRAPVCATYSADGTQVVMETQGQQRTVRSAY
jgi:hypothetical protein